MSDYWDTPSRCEGDEPFPQLERTAIAQAEFNRMMQRMMQAEIEGHLEVIEPTEPYTPPNIEKGTE